MLCSLLEFFHFFSLMLTELSQPDSFYFSRCFNTQKTPLVTVLVFFEFDLDRHFHSVRSLLLTTSQRCSYVVDVWQIRGTERAWMRKIGFAVAGHVTSTPVLAAITWPTYHQVDLIRVYQQTGVVK